MTAMVSTLLRCLRGSGSVVVGCLLLAAMASLGGCTRSVVGTVHAVAPEAEPRKPAALPDLLIEPDRFPAHYPAVVLDPRSVGQAIADIEAVPAGAVVTPPECAPAAAPRGAVAARGTDATTSSSLTVVVMRTDAPLSVRRDQLSGCPSFTATAGDVEATVTAVLLAAPPVDADDTYSVDQTVSTPSAPTRRSLILVAQIDDVRVNAVWTTPSDDTAPDTSPDTQALDALFTDAVLKVRRDGRP
jgi:hypothetical protein